MHWARWPRQESVGYHPLTFVSLCLRAGVSAIMLCQLTSCASSKVGWDQEPIELRYKEVEFRELRGGELLMVGLKPSGMQLGTFDGMTECGQPEYERRFDLAAKLHPLPDLKDTAIVTDLSGDTTAGVFEGFVVKWNVSHQDKDTSFSGMHAKTQLVLVQDSIPVYIDLAELRVLGGRRHSVIGADAIATAVAAGEIPAKTAMRLVTGEVEETEVSIYGKESVQPPDTVLVLLTDISSMTVQLSPIRPPSKDFLYPAIAVGAIALAIVGVVWAFKNYDTK